MSAANIPADLDIPKQDGEPVFAEPWEARAFAMVVNLHERGAFTWSDFQSALIEQISSSEKSGTCQPYYINWLRAAEKLFEQRALVMACDVDAVVEKLRPEDRTITMRDKVQATKNVIAN